MINIYTDASVSSGVAVASCMLLSDKSFIGFDAHTYTNIQSSQVGEILAIRDGLRFYEQTGLSDSEVILYTDHEYAIRLISSRATERLVEAREFLKEIISLVDKHNVSIQHITAHQSKHNPNKVVDQVSRHKLRSALRKEKM